MESPRIMILGTADWDQPIATNQHYMTRELSIDYPSIFIESLGLRRPELSILDIKRVSARLAGIRKRASNTIRSVPANTRIHSPIIIPFHGDFLAGINTRLLNRGLVSEWSRYPGKRVLWTYSPVTYGLEKSADACIYHCVDLLGEFPGIDRDLIAKSEKRLAKSGVQAVASSEVVRKHLVSQGFNDVMLWPNVADAEQIIDSASSSNSDSRTRSVVFAGNLTPKKIDFLLLRRLIGEGVKVELAGPVAQGGGDANAALNELVSLGADYHGMLDIPALSKLLAASRVGVIPYELNSYTRGVSPLKVYEYLAAGLHVVSTAIPGVSPIPAHVDVAVSADDFVECVIRNMDQPTADTISARQEIAVRNSWTHRGRAARDLVHDQLVSNVKTRNNSK